jgi:hypothetical protein
MQTVYDQKSDQLVKLQIPPEDVILALQEFAQSNQVDLYIR